MTYIKVQDSEYLERDMNSNGIVNSDFRGYQQYVEIYRQKYVQSKKINDLEHDMGEIKSDLYEIKKILQSFIPK
jgi:hypothetical protein